ncbi:MAG: DUF1876 domain-containing protein [Propionibacteriales bacterium]|nr:DUF1876 domain-containing protein [Propionibacteriales bacterium]
MQAKTWQMQIFVYEDDTHTKADAVLTSAAGTELRHTGLARLNPADRNVPEIGDELAVCRALNGLAHDLLEATLTDVELNSGRANHIAL